MAQAVRRPSFPRLLNGLRLLPEKEITTPFGAARIPEIELPPPQFPSLDDKRRAALRHALGADAASIFTFIPYLGNIIEGNISAMHHEALRQHLSEEELRLFNKRNKLAPFDTVALVRAFLEKDMGGSSK
jgi:hypothetical protein